MDVRYALRFLRRNPGYATLAVVTLAVGIGANTAIFSFVHAALIRPLPYPEPDRLVMLWQDFSRRGGPANEWGSPANYVDWREQRDTFSSISAVGGWGAVLTGNGDPEVVPGAQVTYEYFDTLGGRPILGRTFRESEGQPNAERVAVLSHGLWERRFGTDPDVVGQVIDVGGEPHLVVGVVAPGFEPPVMTGAQIFRPIRLGSAPPRGAITLRIIGRLQPDVDLGAAQAHMDLVAQRSEELWPEYNTRTGILVQPLREAQVSAIRRGLLVLLGAVGFVLLMACANAANLMLARASTRGREMAVRLALGASRGRLGRQLIVESVVVAVLAGSAGILLAYWTVDALHALLPEAGPRLRDVAISRPVLLFCLATTGLTGLICGLVPALQVSASRLTNALRDGRGSVGPSHRVVRRLLVASEVAVTLLLLVGAGLLGRSFLNLQEVELGYQPAGVLTGEVLLPPSRYDTHERRVDFYDRLLERVSALPGVRATALTTKVPMTMGDGDVDFTIEGREAVTTSADQPVAWYRLVSAGYFDVLQIPIVNGRALSASEPTPALVVNETMAEKYWPGENPIGRRIRVGRSPWLTIVGIARDVKTRGPGAAPVVEMFTTYSTFPESVMAVLLRTDGDPLTLAGPLKGAVRELDADMPVDEITTLQALVDASLAQPRFLSSLLTAFALCAVLLAAVGVYGVMSFAVAQRVGEFGIRIALGASARDVYRLVVRDGLGLVAVGMVAGLLGALALTRVTTSLLYGVAPTDPLVFVGTALLLGVVAVVAAAVPARRASRVDPIVALRAD
jgi:putative ABC transport system permease protein